MRLIKRRSAPVFEHDPLPSSISLVDLGGPGIASTSRSPPPLYPNHSALDVRLPNRHDPSTLTSTSQYTYPQLENPTGAEYLDAHTSGNRNVFKASNSTSHSIDDEDRRWSDDVSPRERIDESQAGKKRDSGGQNRYPPNSLIPGNGWGFGRMRRSRRQDMAIVPPLPLRRDSLS